MKNIILKPEPYTQARNWLRTTEIVWRDLSSSCLIPAWGEAICNSDYMIGRKTCAQVAWQMMNEAFPGIDLNWTKAQLDQLNGRPPLFFSGAVEGCLWYIDIKSTYQQFYRYLSLDGKGRYKLNLLAAQFDDKHSASWKVARNSIVGIARSTSQKWVQGARIWKTHKHNRFLSPPLWGMLMGLLNQFACHVLDNCNPVMINTDGYIFRDMSDYIRALNYFQQKGIAIGTKGGAMGRVTSLNSVNLKGLKVTKSTDTGKPVSRIIKSNYDFFSEWSELRNDATR